MACNREQKETMALHSIMNFIQDNIEWQGSMTELNSALKKYMGKKSITKSPAAFRTILNSITNKLRSRKVSVKFGRTNSKRFVSFCYNR